MTFPLVPLGALGDSIQKAIKKLLEELFAPISDLIGKHSDALVRQIVSTPNPNRVYGPPTNKAWPAIYDYYWESIIPLALLLYGLSIGLVIFLESTSYLFSTYHRSKLKKRAFSGLLGILAWWWLAAISLRFIDALTGFIVPDLSDITLFQTVSFGAISVLGTVISLFVSFSLFVLIALVYLIRETLLYFFVLLMPVLIALWVPGVGPFAIVSRFVGRLAGFFVPFLFMTLPVALLFRLGELVARSADLSMGGLGRWLVALVIPFIALLSPFVLIWQAGALFLLVDRVGRQASARQARARVGSVAETGRQTAHRGENLVRGLRGQGATVYQPPRQRPVGFRAHSAGTSLNQAGTRLGSSLRDNRWGGNGGGGDSGGPSGGGSGGSSGGDGTPPSPPPRDTAPSGEVPAATRPVSRNGDTASGGGSNPSKQRASRTGTTTHVPVSPASEPPWKQTEPDGNTGSSPKETTDTTESSTHIPVPPASSSSASSGGSQRANPDEPTEPRGREAKPHIPVPPASKPPWQVEEEQFRNLRGDRGRNRRTAADRRRDY